MSRVSSSLVRMVLSNGEALKRLNVDPLFTEAFLTEVRRNCLPNGVQVSSRGAKIRRSPLGIDWEGFSLSQAGEMFHLSFIEPESARPVDLTLRPKGLPLTIVGGRQVGGSGRGMNYVSYPRLSLFGKVGETQVEGQAWLDHQWGNLGWFMTSAPEARTLGWDWFGINLDNGLDLLVLAHRDAKTGEPIVRYAVLGEVGRAPRRSRDVLLRATRTWKSPRTAIVHPVEWEITVPDFGLQLSFVPLTDDQEIPVFGPLRAIWEGAGRIAGWHAGRPVEGRARGEFLGYGYVFSFRDLLQEIKTRIDRHIEAFLPKVMNEESLETHVGPATWRYEPSAYTEMLTEPVWDMISRQGKSWRPIFGLFLLHALGKHPDPYEELVSVLTELSHTGALIIDDLEDRSLLRRGHECIHLRYGPDIAVNAANTIYFLPTLLISRHPLLNERQKLEIHEIMMRQFVRAHYGQALDLYWSRNMSPENLEVWLEDGLAPKILQMYEFKTAAALEGLAETAAIIAEASGETRRACRDFARGLGVAFQIVDDVHCFGKSPEWRKVAGEDLAEGKMTYAIYSAIERLNEPAKGRLNAILSSKETRSDPAYLAEGVRLIRDSGSLEACREEAKNMARQEWSKIDKLIPPSEPKTLLQVLSRYLLGLNFDA